VVALMFVGLAAGQTIGLRKTAYLPRGASGDQGRVKVFDVNHNAMNDVVFSGWWRDVGGALEQVFFYENIGYDIYLLRDSICLCTAPNSYDLGYLDNDSLTDAVVQCNLGGVYSYAVVFESPDYYSYPTQIVWQWRYEVSGGSVAPSFIGDFDRDGRTDFLTIDCYVIYVFENTGDNQWQKVYWDTLKPEGAYLAAIGDYDQDSAMEMVMGTPNGYVYIYECTGDNRYSKVCMDTLPQPNLQDLWSGNDLDNDGKPEFLIGSFRWPYGYHLFVFEATGDNMYDFVLVDSILSKDDPKLKLNGHSSCGDVDGDGRDEIVWAIADRFSIYKGTGNNQYQMMYRSPRKRYTSTHAVAYDVNKNGYAEIIESAAIDSPYVRTETTIWEIEGVRLHRPNGGEVIAPGSQFPICWEKFTPPDADSFTLFISFNNGVNYQTIATIQQSNDTLFLWSVPDSLSDSCKLMIWAYGPPRPGQDVPRGTAWDFSDTVFAIRQVGIKEEVSRQKLEVTLRILQNPALSKNLRIQYSVPKLSRVKLSIYNTLGQEEIEVVDDNIPTGLYEGVLTRHLEGGIYFITLVIDDKMASKKVIVIE